MRLSSKHNMYVNYHTLVTIIVGLVQKLYELDLGFIWYDFIVDDFVLMHQQYIPKEFPR